MSASGPPHNSPSGPCLKSSLTESILYRKVKQKSRKPYIQTPQTHAPTPSATLSRLQSFGRTCLNTLSRNKDQSVAPVVPVLPVLNTTQSTGFVRDRNDQQKQCTMLRKPSGIAFAKVQSSRHPPLSPRPATIPSTEYDHHRYRTRKSILDRRLSLSPSANTQTPFKPFSSHRHSSASSASTASSSCPYSTFLDSPVNSSGRSTPNCSDAKLHAPSVSSSSSCCSISSSNSASSRSSSIQTPLRHSDLEPLTALDFLLTDRHHHDNGHHPRNKIEQGFVKRMTEETNDTFPPFHNGSSSSSNNNNKQDYLSKKKVATMHRISVPVRSCSSLFQPTQHKHKQTSKCHHHHHHHHHQQHQSLITPQQPHHSILSLGEHPHYHYHQHRHQSVAFGSLPSSTSSLQLSGDSPAYGNTAAAHRPRVAGFETPLVMPSRARSVFRMMDLQQKEQKAILVWRNTVTQLDKEKEHYYHHRRQPVKSALPPNLDEKTELKRLALQRFIINEIYATEQSYHELLLLVKTRYMIPMLAASKVKDPLVKFNDIPILFNHLSALIDLSEKILAGFTMDPHSAKHSAMPLANVASSIGYQWLQLQSDWTVFLKYAVHYEINTKTIKRACSNVLLLKIEQDSLARKDTKRMGMADYLIAPIQRVPRYCLLLKDLLRHTSITDVDHPYLVKVVNSMVGLARAMNDAQKLHGRKTTSLS